MNSAKDDCHYINLARNIAIESNCKRRQVGALIIKDDTILISAANGTPTGVIPCNQGGCIRCWSNTGSGEDYESCTCIHAEQRAIAMAASRGLSVKGSTMYVTLRPCIPCINLCINAGILNIIYAEEISFKPSVEQIYIQFVKTTGISLKRCY